MDHFIIEFVNKYVFEKSVEYLEKTILRKGNAHLSYWFSLHSPVLESDLDLKAYEQIVIESNDPELIYLFAKNAPGADIDKLTDAIIKTNNSEYIYLLML